MTFKEVFDNITAGEEAGFECGKQFSSVLPRHVTFLLAQGMPCVLCPPHRLPLLTPAHMACGSSPYTNWLPLCSLPYSTTDAFALREAYNNASHCQSPHQPSDQPQSVD